MPGLILGRISRVSVGGCEGVVDVVGDGGELLASGLRCRMYLIRCAVHRFVLQVVLAWEVSKRTSQTASRWEVDEHCFQVWRLFTKSAEIIIWSTKICLESCEAIII